MARFAFFSTCPEPCGGSEELWMGAATRLAEAGHSVTIFKTGFDPRHPRIARLLALGCRVRDLSRFCLPAWLPMPKWMAQATGRRPVQRAMLPLLRPHLASFNPDLVVVSQAGNLDGLVYSDLCRTSARPYVVISQKATDHLWPFDQERKMLRSAYQAALRCYFVSEHNLRLTENQIGESLPNAQVVRNPFLVSGASLPWPSPDDKSARLACVARLQIGEKGQDILLQVLARPRWRDRNITVSFFGAGPNAEALRELAARLELNNVRFAGFVSDVESIWKTHQALILPSRTEGLPLALVEAMMCGRFGIVTGEGGSAEVVEDGRTGFVAAAAKVDQLDEAMERAWAVREDWNAIGDAAAKAIRKMVPADPLSAFTAKLLGHVGAVEPRPYAVTASRL